jgi:predicted dehydrogenase
MARTVLTPIPIAGGSSVGVKFTEVTFTAGDNSNGNKLASTGKEELLAYNSGAYTRKLTVYGTAGSIEKDMAAGEYWTSGIIPASGWKQTTGDDTDYIQIDVESADILLAGLKHP